MRQWIAAAAKDLQYAARSFRRSPVFSVTAVLTIALGIGASAAVFSVVDRILFRALPYPDSDRLVSVGMLSPSADNNEFLMAPAFLRLRDRQTPFESIAAFAFINSCDLSEANPVRLRCAMVDADFLPTFGIRPVRGRLFTREEDVPKGPGVALLSYGFWNRRFAEDPGVIGKSVELDGQPVTIVGVLPREFELFNLTHADVVRPAAIAINQDGRAVRAFARLKPGVTIAQARSALGPLFEEERARVPELYRPGLSLVVRGLRDRQIWPVRTASWTLLGAVSMVLFMAFVNVANLMLARSAGRRREFAIRQALGAGRGRLLRQALTESLLLSSIGAAAGCALAAALLRFFVKIAPDGILRLDQATLDTRVLLFAAASAAGAGILFGFAPAMERLRQALIAVQIAASLVLLTGAGLLLETLWSMERVPLGIDTRNAVAAHFTLRRGYSEARLRGFYTALEERLGQYPAAAIAATIPPYGGLMATPFSALVVEGRPRFPEGAGGSVAWRAVTPGYFAALGIPLLRGRTFDRADGSLVLSQSLATRLFGNEDPIGRRVSSSVVIGVALDVRNNGLIEPAMPEYYRLLRNEEPPRAASLVVRSPLSPRDVAARIRADIAALDPTLPVRIETLEERVAGMVVRPRFNALLLAGFAAAGLLLAVIGIYGVVAFLVAQRTRDIGIRMALGATPALIVRHFIGYAARWTAAGIVLGTAGSLLATRLAATLLFGATRADASSLAMAAAILTGAALAAAWLPSRRAARIDPTRTLRE